MRTVRRAGLGDEPVVMSALLALKDKSPAGWMAHTHEDTARANLRRMLAAGNGWWYGTYFILVDAGTEWHSTTRFLFEMLVLKVDATMIPVTDVIEDGLEQLRLIYKCDAIIASDTQIGYMTKKYIACGYTAIGTQLMKE